MPIPNHPENGIVTAPASDDFFDTTSGKTKYDISFVSKVVADKIENAIPPERQARMFLHVDEIFIKLLIKGTGKCKQAYMWCRLTGVEPPLAAFHFAPSCSRDVAELRGTALFQERKNARRQTAKIVDKFFALCRTLRETERPASPVAKAVSYALNIENELRKFLNNPKLNIDNNPAEQLNRSVAILRKNCFFAGSERGGQNLAILYSFAATCKANGIPRKWLEDVLPRLSSTPAGNVTSPLDEAK